LALGSAFIYSGFTKVFNPYEFAAAIQAYQIFSQFLVGLSAALVPWVELVSGAFLVLGIKPRSSLLIIQILLLIFIILIAVTWGRGLEIDCGCSLFFARQVGMTVLLEDGVLLVIAGWLYKKIGERQ
jgi:uncharacterized membrane protein YphA (DoxX/SURF4 family)